MGALVGTGAARGALEEPPSAVEEPAGIVEESSAGVRLSPGMIEPPLTRTSHVSIGSGHGCAVGADGRPICWGVNADGQLGTGDTERSDVPVPVLVPAS